MLGLQRELSAAIAQQIRLRLSPDRLDALARRQTRNADAYDLYLRGRNFANQRTPATTQQAIEYFERATALDPDYALAWSGIADAYGASPINGDAPPLEVRPRARKRRRTRCARIPTWPRRSPRWRTSTSCSTGTGRRRRPAFRRATALDPNSRRAHSRWGTSCRRPAARPRHDVDAPRRASSIR